jgi:hypothetical protein
MQIRPWIVASAPAGIPATIVALVLAARPF